MSGTWSGTTSIVSATGGECIGDLARQFVGAPIIIYPFSITQAGAAISFSLPLAVNSNSCAYSGTVSGDFFTVSANSSCGVLPRPEICVGGQRPARDLKLISATISGRVSGSNLTAT